jgi:hypothetical protein
MGDIENKGIKKAVARTRDYKTVFSTDAGKRVLHDMMQAHRVLSSTFVKGDPDSTILHEGERNVVLRILAILKTSPEDMHRMLEEIHNDNS